MCIRDSCKWTGRSAFEVNVENKRFTVVCSRCRWNFTLSFGRLRQRIELKCVPHVQHDYFSSFNKSDHRFLESSLLMASSMLKVPLFLLLINAFASRREASDRTILSSYTARWAFTLKSHDKYIVHLLSLLSHAHDIPPVARCLGSAESLYCPLWPHKGQEQGLQAHCFSVKGKNWIDC